MHIYREVGRRQTQEFRCRVLSWSSTQIVAEIPGDAPADDYVLNVFMPEQLTRISNGKRLAVRERAQNQPPPSLAPWISRAHVTVQHELWIYGLHFGSWGGGTPRELPAHVRVEFSGNGVRVDLEILRWGDDLVKTWLPVQCEPGEYEVAVIKGEQVWNQSNRMSVLVRPEMAGDANPCDVPGFMHIDTVRPIPITRGLQFTILGNHFDVCRQGAHGPRRIGQGERVVELVDVVGGRARSHGCRIASSNSMTEPDYQDQGNLLWFDDHVVAVAPDDVEPGEYLLRILDRADNRSSNTLRVRVARHPNDALHIERVTVSPIMAGGVREMTIRGRNFGRSRGQSRVDFSPGSLGFLVRDWSNERIRLELAYTVQPGRYSVRIFADETRDDGSNQFVFDIAGHMHIERVEYLDLRADRVKELVIHGQYFGESRGQRVININPVTRIIHRGWSDNEIRIRLSFNISPGRYSIRILEGGDNLGGSNTAHFEVPANLP